MKITKALARVAFVVFVLVLLAVTVAWPVVDILFGPIYGD